MCSAVRALSSRSSVFNMALRHASRSSSSVGAFPASLIIPHLDLMQSLCAAPPSGVTPGHDQGASSGWTSQTPAPPQCHRCDATSLEHAPPYTKQAHTNPTDPTPSREAQWEPSPYAVSPAAPRSPPPGSALPTHVDETASVGPPANADTAPPTPAPAPASPAKWRPASSPARVVGNQYFPANRGTSGTPTPATGTADQNIHVVTVPRWAANANTRQNQSNTLRPACLRAQGGGRPLFTTP